MPKAIEGAHDAILAAARRLLALDGYEKLNMRAIATESAIGTGTIYNYYRAKDEIVFALMKGDWQLALSQMDEAPIGEPGRKQRLLAIFDRLHEFSSKYAMVWRLMAVAPAEGKSPSLKNYSTSIFVAEIALRIKSLLEGYGETRDAAGLADLIAKVFSLFSMERAPDYAALDLLLERLLGSETD
jgi:AcrR family transcriptional regulator